jgi:predicted RND superfamily exporter protein
MSAATFAPDLDLDTNQRGFRILSQSYVFAGQIDERRPKSKDFIMIEKVSFDQATAKTSEEKAAFQQRLDQMRITSSQAAQLAAVGLSTLDRLLYEADGVNVPGLSSQELKQLQENAQQWQNKHGVDLWRISLRVWALKGGIDIDYAKFIDEVKSVVEPLMGENAASHRKVQSADAITAVYTGMVPVVYKTQHALLSGLRNSFALSYVSIMFVLMFVLRSPMAGFLAMLPNLFPIVIIFGIIGWTGILVDVGMMMTVSVALGVAVDDTIHYLTWFREAIDRGLDAPEAAIEAYEKCATAMTETTIIAGLGLSAFMFSTFMPTQMFGTMMLVILFTAMFGDLIFLVAILTGPAGRFFCKKTKGTQTEPKPEPVVIPLTQAFAEINPKIELKIDDRYVGRCHIVDNVLDNEKT